jgi:hypothetical protein
VSRLVILELAVSRRTVLQHSSLELALLSLAIPRFGEDDSTAEMRAGVPIEVLFASELPATLATREGLGDDSTGATRSGVFLEMVGAREPLSALATLKALVDGSTGIMRAGVLLEIVGARKPFTTLATFKAPIIDVYR